jgi:hypothetical protein
MVSEILVHSHLSLLFLGYGEAERHGWEHMVKQNGSAHGSQKGLRERQTDIDRDKGARDKMYSAKSPFPED